MGDLSSPVSGSVRWCALETSGARWAGGRGSVAALRRLPTPPRTAPDLSLPMIDQQRHQQAAAGDLALPFRFRSSLALSRSSPCNLIVGCLEPPLLVHLTRSKATRIEK